MQGSHREIDNLPTQTNHRAGEMPAQRLLDQQAGHQPGQRSIGCRMPCERQKLGDPGSSPGEAIELQ